MAKLAVGTVALLTAVGFAACGGEDESTVATQPKGSTGATQAKQAKGSGDSKPGDRKGGTAKGEGAEKDGTSSSSTPRVKNLGNFVPREHDDSGGGAKQFVVKGGDNSVQEFGDEASDSEFEAISTALHNFLDARAVGDWTAACEYLSKSTIESLEQFAERSDAPVECSQVLGNFTPRREIGPNTLLAKEARTAAVGSARIEGDRAFVIYRIYEGTIIAISMAKEGDEWKVASLGGVPLN